MSDATPLEFAMATVLRETDEARAKAEAELRAAKYAAEQARSLAIDDAVKVVTVYLSGEREGDLDIAELVPRLEALQDTKP